MAKAAWKHTRLAQAVLTGELRECAWEALKAMYFGESTETACVQKLARWASKRSLGADGVDQKKTS